MMLSVYVAGAWVEKKERAEVYIAKLKGSGIVRVTHDWTVDDIPSTITSDAQLPFGERLKRARLDYEGVIDADLVWLLAPNERGASGAWTEFGMAIASRDARDAASWSKKMVIASGKGWQRTIFTSLADMGFDSDEEALTYVLDHAGIIMRVDATTLKNLPF